MTDTQTAPAAPAVADLIDAQIKSDPRLQAIENAGFQRYMALETMIGTPWEVALKKFHGMLTDSKNAAADYAAQTKKQREDTLAEFVKATRDVIYAAALESEKQLAPMFFDIRVSFDVELKADGGSPLTDDKGNPIRGTTVEFTPVWETKAKRASSAESTNGVASGAGRKPGKYQFDGTIYDSMADYATAKHAAAFKEKGTKTTRAFLESLGYEIPDDAQTIDDKPVFVVKMPEPKTN